MKMYVFALLVTAGAFAHADLLKLTEGSQVIGGVHIPSAAVATVAGKDYDLTTVGAGMRTKRVMFNVDVYVAQLMLADASAFVRTDDGALPSLDKETSVAIRLSF